ncbi:MAG: TonB-dependent receptor [Steroidobacteraceae bacterium]
MSLLKRSIAHVIAAASLTAVSGGGALAQESGGQPAASGAIEEIIVSARRRDESIQDTPIAVTAIAPSQLEGAAAVNISDLQGAAPNVLITQQGSGSAAANISIRGIAFADIEKSFDPAVGINVDGVYIGTSTGQYLDFFDIGSIEILRGPQGTLFGRNTISGVINIKRTRPTGEWGGKFEVSKGSYGKLGVRGVLNVPIAEGVLAAKLFEMHEESDGYYKEIGTGHRRGGYNNENFGASFLLTPSDRFDALLTLEKQVQDFEGIQGSSSQAGDLFCLVGSPPMICGNNVTDDPYKINPMINLLTGQPNPYIGRYRAPAGTLEMNFDAGAIKFTSVSSYREMKEEQQQDYATSGLYWTNRTQKYRQFSQELRGAGKIGENFDYVAGVYYFKSRYKIDQQTHVFGPFSSEQFTTGWSESYAGFADLNWEIFDRVRLSGGGRWTHDKKSLATDFTDFVTPAASFNSPKKSSSWSKFTPKLGLDYRPTDDLMVYGSWSRGYRSGGYNGRGLTTFSASLPYDPESVDAFELGLKSEFLDSRVSLNLAAFYTKYKDIQQSTTVSTPGGTGNETIVTNAASAKIKGFEADLVARLTEEFTLKSSIGITDAKFGTFLTDAPVAGVRRTFDYSDVDMIYAPKMTLSVNAEYETPVPMGSLDGSIKAQAGFRYLSRYDQQIAADAATPIPAAPATIVVKRNDPTLRSDKQYYLDASLSYIWGMGGGDGKARVTVYGRNLFDDRGTGTSFTVGNNPILWRFVSVREPRTWGVSLGYEF